MSAPGFSCKRHPEKLELAPMRSAFIIAIDGDNGAGKTELAKELCRILNGTHIEFDQLLSRDKRHYVEHIDKSRLFDHIESSLNFPIILDGVKMLDVLDSINRKADHLIFGKAFFLGKRTLERYLSPTVALPRSRLTREIAIYYRDRSPWLKADQSYELHHNITSARPQSA